MNQEQNEAMLAVLQLQILDLQQKITQMEEEIAILQTYQENGWTI